MNGVREPFADGPGLKGMRMLAPAAAFLLVLLVSACGAGEPGAVGGSTGATDDAPPPTVPAPDPERLYEADGIVLEDASHGPELCLGGVALSLPPQCGGVPLANWDWGAVSGAQSGSGTTWGEYHVVGTYDGGVLTVTEVGAADPDRLDSGTGTIRSFATPCPEPAGGWPVAEYDLAADEEFAAGAGIAQARPDHVALWVDYGGGYTLEQVDQRVADGKPVAENHERRGDRRRGRDRGRHPQGLARPPVRRAARGQDAEGARRHPGRGRALHPGGARARDDLVARKAMSAWRPRWEL